MECGLNWQHKTVVLIDELTQGIEHTEQLRAYSSSVASTSDGTQELLLHKILSSYEKSLSIVKGSGGSTSQTPQHPLSTAARAVESPVSANASPRTDDMNKRSFNGHQEFIDSSKRRSYLRCTNRWSQGCKVTKLVQKATKLSDPAYLITYKGSHTCRQATEPTSPQSNPTEQLHQLFQDFRVNANDGETNPPTSSAGFTDRNQYLQLSHAKYDNLIGGGAPSFASPNTTESSYFSVSRCQMNSSFGTVHSFCYRGRMFHTGTFGVVISVGSYRKCHNGRCHIGRLPAYFELVSNGETPVWRFYDMQGVTTVNVIPDECHIPTKQLAGNVSSANNNLYT